MHDIDRKDQDELMAHFLEGIHKIDPYDLAFLFVTGKSEQFFNLNWNVMKKE